MLRSQVNNSTPLLVANTEAWGPQICLLLKKTNLYSTALPLHMEEATATVSQRMKNLNH